jgi:hypothetical protein
MPLQRASEVSYEVLDGRAVILDEKGEEIITLNAVGTLVWEAIDGRRDTADLVSHLLPQLEGVGEDELRSDIEEFLGELQQQALVTDAHASS